MNHSIARVLSWSLAAALLLSGCAAGYLLENDVQSFGGLSALPPNATYRFERLPSQQSPGQAQLEAMAEPALQRAGLRRDDANPHFSVQVSAGLQRALSPWASSWDSWGWGGGFHHVMPLRGMESPWFQRQVTVILRELPSNRVVFESHAANDGPWLDDSAVLPAMFQAALQGFPNPTPGPHRVAIQLSG